MNHLSFMPAPDQLNGLIFELLIDGKPISESVGCADSCIPYWLIQGDLADTRENPSVLPVCERLVTVCDCGESGCGSTQARVTKSEETVTLSNFKEDCKKDLPDVAFVFARANYEDVMCQMTELAAMHRAARG